MVAFRSGLQSIHFVRFGLTWIIILILLYCTIVHERIPGCMTGGQRLYEIENRLCNRSWAQTLHLGFVGFCSTILE
jgi:hypothetical protein